MFEARHFGSDLDLKRMLRFVILYHRFVILYHRFVILYHRFVILFTLTQFHSPFFKLFVVFNRGRRERCLHFPMTACSRLTAWSLTRHAYSGRGPGGTSCYQGRQQPHCIKARSMYSLIYTLRLK